MARASHGSATMFASRHLLLLIGLAALVTCDRNPRSEQGRDGTGQTGNVTTEGVYKAVEGEVDVPPTAAFQPVELGTRAARDGMTGAVSWGTHDATTAREAVEGERSRAPDPRGER